MGDRIASVTSVHGMNRGTHFSTGLRASIAEGSATESVAAMLIDSVFNFLEIASTDSSDDDILRLNALDRIEGDSLKNIIAT